MSDATSSVRAEPLIRHPDEIDYEVYDVAPGMQKGVLLNEDQHEMPNLALRRFTLDGHSSVPKHKHATIEHEQYVLEGEYIVGIDDEEYEVGPGDTIYIPADTVHWYRNEGDEQAAFLCAVPNGDDSMILLE